MHALILPRGAFIAQHTAQCDTSGVSEPCAKVQFRLSRDRRVGTLPLVGYRRWYSYSESKSKKQENTTSFGITATPNEMFGTIRHRNTAGKHPLAPCFDSIAHSVVRHYHNGVPERCTKFQLRLPRDRRARTLSLLYSNMYSSIAVTDKINITPARRSKRHQNGKVITRRGFHLGERGRASKEGIGGRELHAKSEMVWFRVRLAVCHWEAKNRNRHKNSPACKTARRVVRTNKMNKKTRTCMNGRVRRPSTTKVDRGAWA